MLQQRDRCKMKIPAFAARLPPATQLPHMTAIIPDYSAALNLRPSDLSERCAPEVVSTGLRYLVVPVERGLDRVRVVVRNFDALLASVNAQYAYVVDLDQLEGRHWTNDGLLEDIATGSGAGTAAAYLARHGEIETNREYVLKQGRFAGRPSEIRIQANGTRAEIRSVLVGGDVALVGQGSLHVLPARAA
jgi:trans-2,3-dihydro-3-hydroxyanthranilate isomerase